VARPFDTGAHEESQESLSDEMVDAAESSDAWEEVSDQIDAEEVDADAASAAL
jgi:hypothetical protein